MVFSDPVFLFIFLPIALISFLLTRKFVGGTASVAVLVLASCAFYAYWSAIYLLLLLGQITVNYICARTIKAGRIKHVLTFAVIFNLSLLGYFKYRNFFLGNLSDLFGWHLTLIKLAVPLAISFHTFQQIALLMDVKDEEADPPPFLNYVFFVVFFPQLIAGPIVLHREMGAQVTAVRNGGGLKFQLFGAGVFLFIFGLWKKICLADMLGPNVDIAFFPGLPLQTSEAWLAALGYALQLYMDFSGYSDMAVGLGLMFGFRLPNNFLQPYRSTGMIEYWTRWHITLSRFFTMYSYMPMSLNLTRSVRRRKLGRVPAFALSVAFPTLVTFFLSGLWHGAGWTFIVWGVIHGLSVVANHVWNDFEAPKMPKIVGWLLTMVVLLVSFVYFRAVRLDQANYMVHQMFVPTRFALPTWMGGLTRHLHVPIPLTSYEWLRDPHEVVGFIAWVVIIAPLSLLLPAFSARPESIRPTWLNAFAIAGMALLVLGLLDQPRSFLYFAF